MAEEGKSHPARWRDRWPARPPRLDGAAVRLREWRTGDVPAVYEACQDPAIQRWTHVPVPYLRREARAFVTEVAPENWERATGALFAVVDDHDAVVGSCGLVRIDEHRGIAEAGYWVAPWARGRGVATAALSRLTDWALDVGFAAVELLIDEENAASRSVAAAAGFTPHGMRVVEHRGAPTVVGVHRRSRPIQPVT